jgi:drug/metabolite transporter (DMT)-like permease
MRALPSNQLRLHFIVFLWGFTGILGALISLDAFELVFYRMGLAILTLWIWAFWRKKEVRVNPKQLGYYLMAGAVIAVHWVTFFHAIKVSNVSITLSCMSTVAVFVSILEPILYKRPFKLQEILLALLGVAGLVLIFGFESEYRIGIITAVTSAFLAAVFSTVNGLLVRNDSAVKISMYELSGGWLVMVIYLAITGAFQNGLPTLVGLDLLWLMILGTVCTAYAFIVSVDVMRELSPFTVVLTINLEPVYGIILALLIFGSDETMSPFFYLGTLIILVSVVLNGLLNRRRRLKKTTKQNT